MKLLLAALIALTPFGVYAQFQPPGPGGGGGTECSTAACDLNSGTTINGNQFICRDTGSGCGSGGATAFSDLSDTSGLTWNSAGDCPNGQFLTAVTGNVVCGTPAGGGTGGITGLGACVEGQEGWPSCWTGSQINNLFLATDIGGPGELQLRTFSAGYIRNTGFDFEDLDSTGTVTWVPTTECAGGTTGGKLVINASNQVVCATDQGGAGGGGTADATDFTGFPSPSNYAPVTPAADPGDSCETALSTDCHIRGIDAALGGTVSSTGTISTDQIAIFEGVANNTLRAAPVTIDRNTGNISTAGRISTGDFSAVAGIGNAIQVLENNDVAVSHDCSSCPSGQWCIVDTEVDPTATRPILPYVCHGTTQMGVVGGVEMTGWVDGDGTTGQFRPPPEGRNARFSIASLDPAPTTGDSVTRNTSAFTVDGSTGEAEFFRGSDLIGGETPNLDLPRTRLRMFAIDDRGTASETKVTGIAFVSDGGAVGSGFNEFIVGNASAAAQVFCNDASGTQTFCASAGSANSALGETRRAGYAAFPHMHAVANIMQDPVPRIANNEDTSPPGELYLTDRTREHCMTFDNPTATNGPLNVWRPFADATLVEVWCQAETNTLTINIQKNGVTDLLTSDLVCDADGEFDNTNLIPSEAAYSGRTDVADIDFAADSTPASATVCFYYRIDPQQPQAGN